MRDRHVRLARVVRLFDVLQNSIQARRARLAGETAALDRQEQAILDLLGAPEGCSDGLQHMASRRLASIARERMEIAARLEAENERHIAAEKRARAAARLLGRIRSDLEDQARRRSLEEIRLGSVTASACGKPDETKL